MQKTYGKIPNGEREKIINFLSMIKAKANGLTMTKVIGATMSSEIDIQVGQICIDHRFL